MSLRGCAERSVRLPPVVAASVEAAMEAMFLNAPTDAPTDAPTVHLSPPEAQQWVDPTRIGATGPVCFIGNPEVSHFIRSYRPHTDFSIESIECVFGGVVNFGKHATLMVNRNGDLVSKMTLDVLLPGLTAAEARVGTKFSWIPFVGESLIRSVSIEIGGQEMDKHYGEWLHIWNELTTHANRNYHHIVNGMGGVEVEVVDPEKADTRTLTQVQNERIADIGRYRNPSTYKLSVEDSFPEQHLQIPLQFWFNRHIGLAIPLIALQFHEVRINVEFEKLEELFQTTNPELFRIIQAKGIQSASIYTDYIYLDADERSRFAKVGHEYLIERVDRVEVPVYGEISRVPIRLNHSVKELVWVPNSACGELLSTTLWVGEVKRFTVRAGDNQALQILQSHTGSPSRHNINVYSFTLNPEKFQPSGSMNFSSDDNVAFEIQRRKSPPLLDALVPPQVHIYAVSQNVLSVMSGIAGLLFPIKDDNSVHR